MESAGQFEKMVTIIKELYHKLYIYKLPLLISLLVITFITYLISDDFVADDAYEEPSDRVIYVVEGTPIVKDIILTDQNVQAITFLIDEPEVIKNDGNIYIDIYDNNKVIFQNCIKIQEAVEQKNTNGIWSISVGEALRGIKGHKLVVCISSDVNNNSQALRFRLAENEEVWVRLVYKIMSKNIARIFFGGGIFASIFVLYCVRRGETLKEPENLFLCCSIILGALYLFVMPMFRVPDSVNHYVRAYGILEGNFLTPKEGQVEIPENLIPYAWHSYTPYILFKNFNMHINASETVLHNNVNMALYSPISYVFQIIGIGTAKLFSDNTYIWVIAGCVTNFVGCTMLLYLAIKRIPYGKLLLTFISLLPMAIQERASLSIDAITYASIMALFALCLSFRYNKNKITRREYIVLIILIFIVSSCKVVYFVTAFLFLVIPKECFDNLKSERIFKIIGTIETIVLSVGWSGIAVSYLEYTRGGYETREKIKFILSHPIKYSQILFKVFWEDGERQFQLMIGKSLGSMDIPINATLIFLITILICRLYFSEKWRIVLVEESSRDWILQFFLQIICLGTFLLIATSLYIQWTSIEEVSNKIEGIQGRYFLPILPLFCYSFFAIQKKNGVPNFSIMDRGKQTPIVWLYVINLLVLVEVCIYTMG